MVLFKNFEVPHHVFIVYLREEQIERFLRSVKRWRIAEQNRAHVMVKEQSLA